MRFPRVAVALLAFSLVVLPVILGPIAGTSVAAAQTATPDDSTATPGIERPDPHTIITIDVRANGDARWKVTSLFVVETANETAAFEDLARSIENGNADFGYSVNTFRRAANVSETATGREMTIENADWTTDLANETGRITLEFTWTDFARVEASRIVVDDAFASESGTWFPWLGDGQRLVINPPATYAPIDTPLDRGPVNGSLIWEGPREFESDYFSIVYRPVRDVTPTTSMPNPTTTPAGPTQETSPLFWVGLVLLIVAVGAGGYFFAVRQRRGRPSPGGTAESEATGTTNEGSSRQTTESESVETATEGDRSSTATPTQGEKPVGTAAVDVEVDETAGPAESEVDAGIDPELLSDEERVERLLEENGGRMKQANIVKETGWSNAKVSQLLSSMAEDGRVDKLRIGRENLITLPDEDVTDF
jgi:uncharacterized membrane protein